MYNLANFFKASILSIFNFPLKEFVVDEETTGNSERGNIAFKLVFNKLLLDDSQRRTVGKTRMYWKYHKLTFTYLIEDIGHLFAIQPNDEY